MRRRDFIGLFGTAAATWPLGAHAQQPTMPVVGFFRSTPAKPFTHILAAFGQGLNEAGFVEGQNVTIEQRWGDNQLDQLPALADDLVRRQPAVIVGNEPAVTAAHSAAAAIPIVFVSGLAYIHRDRIIKLAAEHRLPAVYFERAFVEAGGLVSYGPDLIDQFRRSAGYVDRVLKGEKPADMPVQAPTKYELVINLETAKSLGLTVPPALLASADEVIE